MVGEWRKQEQNLIVKTLAYTRIQSVYLHTKQSTPDGSFNWWVDGEKKRKIVKTLSYKRTVSSLTS